MSYFSFFFFNDTATTEIYTLSLHDALPIWPDGQLTRGAAVQPWPAGHHAEAGPLPQRRPRDDEPVPRSEEHTSELQSRQYLVCRLLLEKKKNITTMFKRAITKYDRGTASVS